MAGNRHFAVILAAGISYRMGEDKAALPWLDGKSLLAWTVDTLSQAGWQPFVVLGPHNHAHWVDVLPRAFIVLNPHAGEGKTTSIAAGVQALPPDVDSILLTGIDQPRPPELYASLREEAGRRDESIIAPDKNGRSGHPIVCHARLMEQLANLREEQLGLRGFLQEHQGSIYRLPCDPAWLPWDFNTPSAYQEALDWFYQNLS